MLVVFLLRSVYISLPIWPSYTWLYVCVCVCECLLYTYIVIVGVSSTRCPSINARAWDLSAAGL